MNFDKYDIIKLSNNKKIIIIEKVDYNNTTYLYVDDVNDDETDTLDNYYIMRVNTNGTLSKEQDVNTLTKIIPLLNRLLKDNK